MLFNVLAFTLLGVQYAARADDVTGEKTVQLQAVMVDTNGQLETTPEGVVADTSRSLRAGPRGYNLLEDTTVRKKVIHFDHERAPERVVHALGHGAFGEFTSYGDWSNLTSACWLRNNAVSEVFTRFSVVVASNGGSENARDTHGFATKIYSDCGNQDLVGNHVPSFFINDGADFPDLIHTVKFEADKGFSTGGSAHTTAYSFFTEHPEGAAQLMYILSDQGITRDVRHISGNGIHTYRFINSSGKSMLYKWYWLPVLGHRTLVYEATKIAGKNNNFQRIDLYNNIEAGNYPEWEFAVQLFPDDGTYMYKGIDLIQSTQVVPFELNPPIKLGKLTLNRNPTNFFAEPESISFAPSNVVDGISFVPDPLLQWRLMSYDDTATHRHNSPNGYLLPINKAIDPVNNNLRDGYMQPLLYEGASTSFPDDIGGVQEPTPNMTLPHSSSAGESAGTGDIGRYTASYDWASQARLYWGTLDPYTRQHTVDGYRFELGNVADKAVVQTYIDTILNPIDNCLARRVAFGIGASMPMLGTGGTTNITNVTTPFPSLYPLAQHVEPHKSNEGLVIGIVADDNALSTAELSSITSLLEMQKVDYDVITPRIGELASGVVANSSYITTTSIFYDAIIIGSLSANSTSITQPDQFINEAYSHGKAIAAIGNGKQVLTAINVKANPALGIYEGSASMVTMDLLTALSGPVRFPARFPVDDASICVMAGTLWSFGDLLLTQSSTWKRGYIL